MSIYRSSFLQSKITYALLLVFQLNFYHFSFAQIKSQSIEIVTTDIDNFWRAYDMSAPNFDPQVFQRNYFDIGSPALKDFIKYSIKNADELSKTILKRPKYYASIRESMLKINSLKPDILKVYLNFQKLYPEIYFPRLYFVIGRMSSGGTGSKNGLIIGAEMYGLTDKTPKDELNDWLKSVLKSVDEIPHIVAHELVHEFQTYDGGSLLAASIKEGGADYIAELISGKHINQHVHNYANPKEKELWLEFKKDMLKNDYTGWLYSSAGERPQDLGYWMGYKITKSYFDNTPDKKQAMRNYLTINDFEKFLTDSRYEKF